MPKWWDHPRMRRTNHAGTAFIQLDAGSPPHTRDKWEKQQEKYIRCRIIPAYAGQILLHLSLSVLEKDHPRIRGTNEIFDNSDLRILGSSPHTRNKFFSSFIYFCPPRIIPAYAGQIRASTR